MQRVIKIGATVAFLAGLLVLAWIGSALILAPRPALTTLMPGDTGASVAPALVKVNDG